MKPHLDKLLSNTESIGKNMTDEKRDMVRGCLPESPKALNVKAKSVSKSLLQSKHSLSFGGHLVNADNQGSVYFHEWLLGSEGLFQFY